MERTKESHRIAIRITPPPLTFSSAVFCACCRVQSNPLLETMGKLVVNDEATAAAVSLLVDSSVEALESVYLLGDVIGEGRFSKVYSGKRVEDGKLVALKEIDVAVLEEDEEALEMLEAEVNALRKASGLNHVVNLHQVVATSDAIFLAMERVPGRELFELVEQRGALGGALVRAPPRARAPAACAACLAAPTYDRRPSDHRSLALTYSSSALPLPDSACALCPDSLFAPVVSIRPGERARAAAAGGARLARAAGRCAP